MRLRRLTANHTKLSHVHLAAHADNIHLGKPMQLLRRSLQYVCCLLCLAICDHDNYCRAAAVPASSSQH